MTHFFKLLTLFAALSSTSVLSGCAWNKPAAKGVAEVPECRQAAEAVTATEFDNRTSVLRRRADAYAECMQGRGYVLDQDELDRMLLREEQVKNSEPLGGDPVWHLERYRQQLRMTAALWRPGTR